MQFRNLSALLAAVVALAACDDGATGPNAGGDGPGATVTLSLMAGDAGAAPSAGMFANELTLTDGTNTLTIESAEVVLREIEFERVDELTGCGDEEGEIQGSDDDACEEFETDPKLAVLPLDGSVQQQISAQVDTGTYDEIEFEVHKVGDDAADLAFLETHPEFDGISVRVIGSWNGSPFEYTSDLNADQEIELTTPLVVQEGSGPINVTLSVDIATWFANADGSLIDPSTALKGEPNEQVVEDNIELSIEGFEDDDSDGVPHDEDADEQDA